LGARLDLLRERLRDERSGKVVLLAHCLLNQNVRYLGGAFRPGMVEEILDHARRQGQGVYQLPCPEQRAWGGVLKRSLAPAYGAKGTLRYRARRPLLWLFTRYTTVRYQRLARRVARDVADYLRSGFAVTGIVGVGGSPSCGVRRTLDLPCAVEAMAACPLAALQRQAFNRDVVAANVVAGEGLFVRELRRALKRKGMQVPFDEHDLLSEMTATTRSSRGPAQGDADQNNRLRGGGGDAAAL
jgi:predicted secreted protein